MDAICGQRRSLKRNSITLCNISDANATWQWANFFLNWICHQLTSSSNCLLGGRRTGGRKEKLHHRSSSARDVRMKHLIRHFSRPFLSLSLTQAASISFSISRLFITDAKIPRTTFSSSWQIIRGGRALYWHKAPLFFVLLDSLGSTIWASQHEPLCDCV